MSISNMYLSTISNNHPISISSYRGESVEAELGPLEQHCLRVLRPVLRPLELRYQYCYHQYLVGINTVTISI